MILKGDPKFKGKLTRPLKNHIMKLVKFHTSGQKPENLLFDELLLSKAHKVLDEKKEENYV